MQRQAHKQTFEYDLFRSEVAAAMSQLLNEPALPFDQGIAFGDLLLSFKQLNHGIETRDDWKALIKAARLDGARLTALHSEFGQQGTAARMGECSRMDLAC